MRAVGIGIVRLELYLVDMEHAATQPGGRREEREHLLRVRAARHIAQVVESAARYRYTVDAPHAEERSRHPTEKPARAYGHTIEWHAIFKYAPATSPTMATTTGRTIAARARRGTHHTRARIISPGQFDLALTIESGQAFRYTKENGAYRLRNGAIEVTLRQENDVIICEGADERTARHLLRIDLEHEAGKARLEQDLVLQPIIERYGGLRILRQDMHETIIAFICSANSNIPKIRQNLTLLAQAHGERLPPPGTAINIDAARAAKTGYRAQYIVDTNRMLTRNFVQQLKRGNYEQNHALLRTLPGIGPKVADCVCLYGLDHGEAFPVDVHIFRAMKALFPRAGFKNEREAKDFAQQRWKKDAGLAQQYIFEWARKELSSAKRRPQTKNQRLVKRKKRGVAR